MSITPIANVKFQFTGPANIPSYFDINFLDTFFQNLFGASTYDAWCADRDISLDTVGGIATVDAKLYSIYELGSDISAFPTIENPQNLDKVNWLLNQNYSSQGYTYGEVQAAIWELLGDSYVGSTSIGTVDSAKIQTLINLANTNGSGFKPDITDNDSTNDFTLLLIAPYKAGGTPQQPTIIQVKSAALGDYVWHDVNGNGVQDANELGIGGAIVKLVRDLNNDGSITNNEVLQTTTTDASGLYKFTGLTPGLDYQVQFFTPAGFNTASPRQQGANTSQDSDGALSDVVVLTAGEWNKSIDSGFFKHASLGNFIWNDKNQDGIQNNNELGIGGVKLTLTGTTNGGQAVTLTTTTNPDGSYLFSELAPGSYQVNVDAGNFVAGGSLEGFTPTAVNQGGDIALDSNNPAQAISLNSGDADLTVDYGFYDPAVPPNDRASIGDKVFDDANGNGIQDSGENGVSGVTVRLFTCVNGQPGTQVGSDIQTDANGNYSFTGLLPGDYTVQFVAPNGRVLSTANVGGDDLMDSDAGLNGFTGCYTLAAGENNTSVDAGLVTPRASIGDKVFDDANGNGIQDSGENGVSGVTVRLFTCVNGQPGTQVGSDIQTDANGNYSFTGLLPGDYTVQFVAPNGRVLSTANVGGDDLMDSDAGLNGFTGCYTLAAGENNTSVDAGLVTPRASIGDKVFDDANGNGIQDSGENGVSGVTVRLFTCVNGQPGTQVGSDIQTDANGNYSFTGLLPGDYTVQFVAPNGRVLSTANVGGDDLMDSDAGLNGFTGCYTLAAGENNTSVDAGLVTPRASIGDKVFDDANGNGIQDSGENGVSGVTVRLFTCVNGQPGTQVGSDIQTDTSGNYSFTGLLPGDYTVQFVAPNGRVLSTANVGGDDLMDSDAGLNGFTGCYTLAAGENNTSVDAGLVTPRASIGDKVFDDANGNGIQDSGENGVSGVTVRLFTCVNGQPGTQVGSDIQTDANGNYSFTGLLPGDYTVQFVAPNGRVLSTANVGGDDLMDSDAGLNGFTGCYTLAAGENNTSVDAGLVTPRASIGDKVFDDANGNGIQDSGENGVSGVTVRLFTCVNGQPGTQVGSDIQTDANGNYSFTGLLPGDYTVQFVAPNGRVLSTANVGGDDLMDSDAGLNGFTGCYTLAAGENNTSVDAGLVTPRASIGDKVFDDANGNGIQDSGENGVSGVTVRLFTCVNGQPGTQVGSDIQTDANGNYSFTGLLPGDYTVQFVAPNGRVLSTANVGGDDLMDSDAGLNGFTGCYTLAAGENNTSVDAGLVTPRASIGDKVFDDANGNGIQDSGENGVSGVTVRLFTCVNGQPGTQVGSDIQTDANGNYSFAGLLPGDYTVQFVAPNGRVLSTANVGGDDLMDSDAGLNGFTGCYTLAAGENNTSVDAGLVTPRASIGDKVFDDANGNGIQDSGENGVSGVTVRLFTCVNGQPGTQVGSDIQTDANGNYSFTGLLPGDYTVQFVAPNGRVLSTANVGGDDLMDSDAGLNGFTGCYTLAAGENNTSVDAGLVTPRASIGDKVFDDANGNGIQDSGENGVSGVTVRLFTCVNGQPGTQVGSDIQTDANGNYSFTGLLPGDYTVQFVAPNGRVLSTANVGGDDLMDSDAGLNGFTGCYTLAAGENNTSVDAGLVTPRASIGDKVFDDANGNGIQDSGENGVSGVTVRLFTCVNGQPGTQVGSDIQTDASGNYSFTGLLPGDYTVQFVAPNGRVLSTANVGGDDLMDSDAGLNGFTGCYTLAAGENNTSVDAGLVTPRASIGDKVFDDANGNGIQDSGENGVSGVTVRLFTCVNGQPGTQVGSDIQTDASGNYSFTGLLPGDYTVQFVAPNGRVLSTANVGGDDLMDSDAGLNGFTGCYTLAAGENNTSVDAGLVLKPASVCLTYDFNGSSGTDGQDGNSRSYTVEGVSVTATAWSRGKSDGAWSKAYLGAYGGGHGVTDSGEGDGWGDKHTVDNVGGRDNFVVYQFSENVTVDKAFLGYVSGDSDVQVWIGSSATPITNMSNSVLSNLGFTEVNTTTSSSARWADINAGNKAGNVLVIAADTTDTSPEDYFKIQKLAVCTEGEHPPAGNKASIGNFVWEDKNFNGIQDAGEQGIKNVTVKLLNAAGNVLATTATDNDGFYHFGDLNAGDYKVQVVQPSGYYFTKKNAGDDAVDSDVGSSGVTGIYTLADGQENLTVDAGLYRKASIGDRVWEDSNHNGIQDSGEFNIKGIRVSLLDGGGNVIANTTTNSSGNYLFSNLDPGTYSLKFDKADVMHYSYWNFWANMNDWKWGTKDAGSNDDKDSDVNNSGSNTRYAYTDQTFLESGENDMRWDAAITPIVIDLNGDGIKTIARADSQGTFDLFGTGKGVHSGWISGDDGLLAVDSNDNGTIDDISELFGGFAQGEGFARLAEFDTNGDSWVDANDADFTDMLIWQDKNGNHQTDQGELISLDDAGIARLNTSFSELPFVDAQGNLHLERSAAILSDGQSVDMTDVYFNVSLEDTVDAGVQASTMLDLLGDTVQAEVVNTHLWMV